MPSESVTGRRAFGNRSIGRRPGQMRHWLAWSSRRSINRRYISTTSATCKTTSTSFALYLSLSVEHCSFARSKLRWRPTEKSTMRACRLRSMGKLATCRNGDGC